MRKPIHTHTHTHTLSLSLSHTHTYPLSLSLLFSQLIHPRILLHPHISPLTHTHSLNNSAPHPHTHTHTRTHTHAHAFFHSPRLIYRQIYRLLIPSHAHSFAYTHTHETPSPPSKSSRTRRACSGYCYFLSALSAASGDGEQGTACVGRQRTACLCAWQSWLRAAAKGLRCRRVGSCNWGSSSVRLLSLFHLHAPSGTTYHLSCRFAGRAWNADCYSAPDV
jgi:hypothetical protein